MLPDIVVDTKLEVEVHRGFTIHSEQTEDADAARPIKQQERWERSRCIGNGGFGAVSLYRCTSGRRYGQQRAVKEVQLDGPSLESSKMIRELEAIGRFSQKRYRHCFVRSFGWYETGNSLLVTMEYLEKGDLSNFIHSPLPEGEAAGITHQLLEGLGYMHDSGFTHRDLKPQNILVKIPGPSWWIKIADFGISKREEHGSTNTTTEIGSGIYMAPEKRGLYPKGRQGNAPSTAADIWAVGIIAWRIVSGKAVFRFDDISPYVVLGEPLSLECDVSLSGECRDFVANMLARSASDRPTCHDAASYTWMQSCYQGSTLTQAAGQIATLDNTAEAPTEDYAGWTTQDTRLVAEKTNYYPNAKDASSSRKSLTVMTVDKTARDDAIRATRHNLNSIREEMYKSSFELGMAFYANKQYPQAEQHFREAAEKVKKIPGTSHDVTISCFQKLGRSLSQQKKWSEAIDAFQQVLEMQQTYSVPCSPKVSNAMRDLAAAFSDNSNYVDAERYYREAAAGYGEVLGPDHPDTLRCTVDLAFTLYDLKNYEESENIFRQAYAGQQRVLGAEHKDTLKSVYYMGMAVYAQKRFPDAEKLFQQSLHGFEKLFGKVNKSTVDSIYQLGLALYSQEKFLEAGNIFRQSVQSHEQFFGTEDRRTVDSVYYLGSAMLKQRKSLESEKLFRRALNDYERTLGMDHIMVLQSAEGLASALNDQGKREQAEDFIRRALKGYQQLYGSENQETIYLVYRLGVCLFCQGKLLEAELFLRRCLMSCEKIQGKSHKNAAEFKTRLFAALDQPETCAGCEDIYQESLQSQVKLLNAEWNTLYSKFWLALTLYGRGRFYESVPLLRDVEHRGRKGFSNRLGLQWLDMDAGKWLRVARMAPLVPERLRKKVIEGA